MLLLRFSVSVFALSCLAAVAPSFADDTRTAVSVTSNISTERLARLDGVLQRYVDENLVPGMVVLVLKDGRPVYEKAFGWRDREAKVAMTTDTIFRIASQTKALTSAAILMLMEEGKLTLSTPASVFIPEYQSTQVAFERSGSVVVEPAKRPITIRDLLTHTSGYSYGTQPHVAEQYRAKGLGPAAGHGWYFADKEETICTSMARLASLPAIAHPGEAYVYGYNTDILGCIVERASGKTLDAFIRERITEPLGMKDTHFFLPRGQRERLAKVYSSQPEDTITRAPEGPTGQGHYVEGPRRSFSGGAGLVSTARDYARFLEMIRNDGVFEGRRLMSRRAVALMRTNQVGELHSGAGLGFGLGFQTVERYGANGMEGVGGFGWGGAYGSLYRVDPEAGLTLVFMMQLLPNTTDVRERVQAVVYQAVE